MLIPEHHHLVVLSVRESVVRQLQLPRSVLLSGKFIPGIELPLREVSNECYADGMRSTLAKDPTIGSLMKTEIFMPGGEIGEALTTLGQDMSSLLGEPLTVVNRSRVRGKPWVKINECRSV
jgi:hypothetical protein